jgi:hypothetical protein
MTGTGSGARHNAGPQGQFWLRAATEPVAGPLGCP